MISVVHNLDLVRGSLVVLVHMCPSPITTLFLLPTNQHWSRQLCGALHMADIKFYQFKVYEDVSLIALLVPNY